MHVLDVLLPLLVAVVCGAIIGAEREFSHKSAGLRTNILICVGAAVFTMVAQRLGGSGEAPARVAAQIVTGVGFLGAGAIIRDRGGIHGLTTGATIWLVASIGVACGIGQYLLAGVATVLTLVVLVALAPLSHSSKYRPKSPDADDTDVAE